MKIAIGCDHRGLELKQALIKYLKKKGHEVKDFGTDSTDSCDYPQYALAVARSVAQAKFDRGILICNSGIGMQMAANKIKKIRAVNCFNLSMARFSREHNNANVLVFGAAFIKEPQVKRMTDMWLKTKFAGGRHLKRVKMFSDC
ncbi:MAG: ribose 5-phosphate isomerase B [PVC group bacterium]|nr:ribose 5-phosphate isomerase B [PVC group bacterium]